MLLLAGFNGLNRNNERPAQPIDLNRFGRCTHVAQLCHRQIPPQQRQTAVRRRDQAIGIYMLEGLQQALPDFIHGFDLASRYRDDAKYYLCGWQFFQ